MRLLENFPNDRDTLGRDIREALDFVAAKLGAATFILIGLCSGADLAFRAALADPRIVGAVLIDGLPYHTVRSRFHNYASRLIRRGGGSWRSTVRWGAACCGGGNRVARPPRPGGATSRRDTRRNQTCVS